MAASRRTLVTGGSGFLGKHLVRALQERGDAVTVLDRSGRAPLPGVPVFALDLLQDDVAPLLAEGRFGSVFHLAGNVEVPISVDRPDLDLAMNAEATLRLLEALRRASPGTALLLTSTAAVYGETPEGPCPETRTPAPVAPYGASKWIAESYVALYARKLGLRTVRARIFSLFGPGLRKHVVFDLIEKLHQDPARLSVLGDGEQVRDFLYVEDAISALVCIEEASPGAGEAVNVASGVPLRIADLAHAICRACGVSPEVSLAGEEGPGRSRRWMADVSRLRALGHRPRISLEEGLARTVAWYRAQRTAGP